MTTRKDRAAARLAVEAMLKMTRIEVAELERAYAGEAVPIG